MLEPEAGHSGISYDDAADDEYDVYQISDTDRLLPNAEPDVEPQERCEEVDKIKLNRYLGLHHGVAIIIGKVIGSAIYITPNVVAKEAGSPGLMLVIWGLSGVMATLGALCFAELGTMLPGSGEKFHYLKEIFGGAPAFSYMWVTLMFTNPGTQAVKCLTFGTYILKPFYSDCEVPKAAVMLLGCNLAMILTYLNCKNLKWAARGQNVFSTLSSFSLVVISSLGIIHLALGETKNLAVGFTNTSTNIGDIILVTYSGIFCYSGWTALNFVVEEMKDPVRDLPRAVCISMAVVTILYVMTNVAYITVLGTDGMAESEAVAVTFGERAMGPVAWIVPIFVAVSVSSSMNTGTMAISRMCFVSARDGYLPTFLSLINVNNLSPITSVIFQGVLVIAVLSIGDVFFIINNITFLNAIFEALCAIGLLYWRWKHPARHRPIKLFVIIPIVYTLMVVGILITTVIWKPVEALVAAVVLSSSIPTYLCAKYRGKLKRLGQVAGHVTRWSALLSVSLPPDDNKEFH